MRVVSIFDLIIQRVCFGKSCTCDMNGNTGIPPNLLHISNAGLSDHIIAGGTVLPKTHYFALTFKNNANSVHKYSHVGMEPVCYFTIRPILFSLLLWWPFFCTTLCHHPDLSYEECN